MTPDQIDRVRASWTLVAPIADTAATLFYDRLFVLDPSLRAMFRQTDLTEQRKKLMQTLGVVVAGLADVQRLLPAVEALGRRHAGYGVAVAHYATVGEALLWTLAQGLGDAFDEATHAAWTAAYTLLAGVMQRAMADAPVAGGALPTAVGGRLAPA